MIVVTNGRVCDNDVADGGQRFILFYSSSAEFYLPSSTHHREVTTSDPTVGTTM